MEIDCHNRSVERYVKVKKGNVLLHGMVKVSAIPFRSRDDQALILIGVNFTFRLLNCDCYIHLVLSLYWRSLNQGFVPYAIQ